METTYSTASAEKLKWVEKIARVMDSVFKIPGTDFKFGLDPILNLIPGAGPMATYIVSAALVMTMVKHGVSRKVIILMIMNVLLDAVIGSIPFLGNIFDFAYRANDKNVDLLRRHYIEGKYQGSGNGILIAVALTFIVAFVLLIVLVIKLISWSWNYFTELG